MSLKFREIIKTPAMQAGISSKKLSFREIFSQRDFFIIVIILYNSWLRKHRLICIKKKW